MSDAMWARMIARHVPCALREHHKYHNEISEVNDLVTGWHNKTKKLFLNDKS